jgi:hypothetical protein
MVAVLTIFVVATRYRQCWPAGIWPEHYCTNFHKAVVPLPLQAKDSEPWPEPPKELLT